MTRSRYSRCSSGWRASCIAIPTLVLLALGAGESTPGDSFGLGGYGGLSFVLASLAFGTVGALVAARVPGNPIGRVFCLMGLTLGIGDLAYQYADQALFVSSSLPGGEAAAWLQNLGLPPAFGLLGIALLLFPDGRLPSRRWRPALWLALTGITLIVVGYALRPGPLDDPFQSVSNPLGVPGAFDLMDAASGFGWMFMGASVAFAAAAARGPAAAFDGIRAPAAQVDRARSRRDRRGRGGRRGQLFRVGRGGSTQLRIRAARRRLLRLPRGGGNGDPPLPPLRHRRRDQPHAGLRCADGDAWRSPTSAACCCCSSLLERAHRATRASRSPAPRSRSRRCSARRERASRTRSTVASSGASTTPRARSRRFGTRLRDEVDLDALGSELRAVVRGDHAAGPRVALAPGGGAMTRTRASGWRRHCAG